MEALKEENKKLKEEIKKLKQFINEEEGIPDDPIIPESSDVGGLDKE